MEHLRLSFSHTSRIVYGRQRDADASVAVILEAFTSSRPGFLTEALTPSVVLSIQSGAPVRRPPWVTNIDAPR